MNARGFLLAGASAACLLLETACGSNDPESASPTITAPTVSQPASGATVDGRTPTLTVGNASGASNLRYRFEVATDSGFTSIAAIGDNIPQGAGSTSWSITPALDAGQTYHWRARASAEQTVGPFSAVSNFTVLGGFASSTPVDDILVFDPLTNQMSVGEVGGGSFRAGGWIATDANSYIRYEIPPTPNGFVEFQVTNLRNPNPRSDKRSLMIMWDPTRGDYTTNPFRVHLAKFDTNLVTRWHMRLRWISNGQEHNTGIDKFDWNPDQIYTFRIEWGGFPEIVSSQRVHVLLDGLVIMSRNYDPIYRPDTHWVELGMAPRTESLERALYSNVTIGVRRP